MKKVYLISHILVPMCFALALLGCGEKADENKPISEIKAEAAKMDVDNLRKMALKYKEAIQAKLGDANELKNKIKDIPVTEMMGEKAKELNEKLEPVMSSINALKERFQVYYEELKKKSGDLTELEL